MTTNPDDLGLNQTRVLDSANRSFESVVYQRKKPPLSCEVNLTSRLASDHAQDVARATSPSGWMNIGSIRDGASESSALNSDVICSSAYAKNTFKLIAKDRGVANGTLRAMVNGMSVLVEGTASSDENNIIALPNPPTNGSSVNFVFLEVWRKLITPSDVIYKNGNVLYTGLDNPPNDLIDPAIDIETSLRIQVQYRIRVASDTDIENYPNGFSPTVFLQGPNTYPLSGSNYFSPVPGDPGLWIAGSGDSEATGTVDGYTYAIPMFAIARRNSSAYIKETTTNGAGLSLADYLAGVASDRPDNKYNDWIVASDILDMRCISVSVNNAKEICEQAFQKLCQGKLRSKMARVNLGQDHYGVMVTQADSISSSFNDWSMNIGTGDSLRRVYSNATALQHKTLARKGLSPGAFWVNGSTATLPAGNPVGAIINSVEDVYTTTATKAVKISPMSYVVLSEGPTTYSIISTDGINWTLNNTTLTYNFNAIAAGNIYVAVGGSGFGVIYFSSDGITWTQGASLPFFTTMYGVAWNVDRFVAVGGDGAGTGLIKSSDEGMLDWTSNVTTYDFAPTSDFKGVVFGAVSGSGLFVAVGNIDGSGFGSIYISPDGISWTQQSGNNPVAANLNSVIWDGSQFIAVGDTGTIISSPDGVNWASQTSGTVENILSIAWQGNFTASRYVATGANGTILISPDGVFWTLDPNPIGGPLPHIFSGISWTGTQFIIAGGGSGYDGDILTSPTGALGSWTQLDLTTIGLPSGIGAKGITCGNLAISGVGTTTVTGTAITTALNNYPITFEYTINYPSGANGFSKLPETVLEIRQDFVDSSSFASINNDIRVKTAPPVIFGDATSFTTLSNRAGNYTELYNFGHQMIHHISGTGGNSLTFDRNLFGYDILGVASLYDGTNYRNLSDVTRTANNYTINSTAFPVGQDITLNLYTGGKFFQTNKQGRGIVETFEMSEYSFIQTGSDSTFIVDSVDKAFIKLASNRNANGGCIAYVGLGGTDVQTALVNSNKLMPTDSTASRLVIEFSAPPALNSTISVPALTHSAISSSEGFVYFYETVPYQGYLASSTGGCIEAEGPSISTTAGSGAISDIVVGVEPVSSLDFILGLSVITTTGGNWLSTVKPGYTINPSGSPDNPKERYKIVSVVSDNQVTLASPIIVEHLSSGYEIRSIDRASMNLSNVIDRLPAYSSANDGLAISDALAFYTNFPPAAALSTINTRIISREQDIMGLQSEDVTVGVNPSAVDGRGRSTVHITGDTIGLGNLGLTFEGTSTGGQPYQKTYQTYVYDKDSSGELYLMVVGSETENSSSWRFLNTRSTTDSVDLFKIPGRPLSNKRCVD